MFVYYRGDSDYNMRPVGAPVRYTHVHRTGKKTCEVRLSNRDWLICVYRRMLRRMKKKLTIIIVNKTKNMIVLLWRVLYVLLRREVR